MSAARRSTSLTEEQAGALDDAFSAALQDDLYELTRLWMLQDPNTRTPVPVDSINRLAIRVAKVLHLEEKGIRNRLYGNQIPRGLLARDRFMTGVQTAFEQLFEEYGNRFESRSYRDFVRPVRDDGDSIGQAPHVPGRYGQLGPFDSWQDVRIGAWLADARNPSHEDHLHRITFFQRTDLLQYETGDFYSIRRVRGNNVSRNWTSHLTYRESSERVFTMAQAQVRAFTAATRLPLVVDPELGMRTGSHTHAFRIYFPRHLAPGDTFDVVYAIRLPGELEDLGRDPEVMSVSLRRFNRGVERLRFEVVTGFEPQNSAFYLLDETKRFVPAPGAVVPPTRYSPRDWFEEPSELGLSWSREPWLISWQGDMPNGRMYVAVFSGAPGFHTSDR